MANFADTGAGKETAEALIKTRMASKTWVNGHVAENVDGHTIVRFQRFMSATHPDYGEWVESRSDSAT